LPFDLIGDEPRRYGLEEFSEGERKSTSAAIAPDVVVALAGIIFGRGRGSVYGTRRIAMAYARRAAVEIPIPL
jgi:hypothetical protein